MFYVYEWYIKDTNEIIYVGKGSKKRYLSKQHNTIFKEFLKRYSCDSRIIKTFENEKEAYIYEFEYIEKMKKQCQCVCNIMKGGYGGGHSYYSNNNRWTEEERKKYSENNVMKSEKQRKRMSENNPMKNKEYALKNGLSHRKPIIIGNAEYSSLKEASNKLNVTIQCISYYLKKGHNSKGEKCYYKYGNQQPSINPNDL